MRHPRPAIFTRTFATILSLTTLGSILVISPVYSASNTGSSMGVMAPLGSLLKPSPVAVDLKQTSSSVHMTEKLNGLSSNALGGSSVWRIESEGIAGVDGMPDLPAVNRLVRVSDYGRITLRYSMIGEHRVKGVQPAVYQSEEEDSRPSLRNVRPDWRGVWPPKPVQMGEPKIWRGVRFVSVAVYPIGWDAEAGEYVVYDAVDIRIESVGGVGINEVEQIHREPCRDFDRAVDALLVNPPRRDEADEDYLPGSYLVVANDNPPNAVDEFIEAKRRAGHQVELLTFDPTIVDQVQLKQNIQDRYNEAGFSFLVLMGNEEVNSPLCIPYDNTFYDNFYGQLEGNDDIPDVAVGTYNCKTVDNLTCAVRRTISYEYAPSMADGGEWLHRVFTAAGHCSPPDMQDFSPSYSVKWIQSVLERHSYQANSIYYGDQPDDLGHNNFSPLVEEQYNQGVNLIIVRGHEYDFVADSVHAGLVYPFHFVVSSTTISPGGGWSGAFNEAFRMGTPDDLRGPSAGFGFSDHPRTNAGNAMVGSMTEALFFLDIKSFGWARNFMVANLLRVFPADNEAFVRPYWGWLRYYGDPGQEPWPSAFQAVNQAVFPAFLDPHATGATLSIEGEVNNFNDAVVCLYQRGGLNVVKSHGAGGQYFFSWPYGALSNNPISVSFATPYFAPVQDTILVRAIQAGSNLTFPEFRVEEVDGNGDGLVDPGEHFRCIVTVFNEGPEPTPEAVILQALTHSDWATGQSQQVNIGVVQSGQEVRDIVLNPDANDPMEVLAGCPDGEEIPVGLGSFKVIAPRFSAEITQVQGDPDRGNLVDLTLQLSNLGDKKSPALLTLVESLSPQANVVAGIFRSDSFDVGEVREIGQITVRVTEGAIRGSNIPLQLFIMGDPGIQDTLATSFTLVQAHDGDPYGPDKYGYIALNNGDDNTPWADAPQYQWINCSPDGGDVQGERLDFPVQGEVDSSLVVDLPFAFRYYGQEYRQITVCNNGWIAVGDQGRLKNHQNWALPGINGAYGMISPFWARLTMQTRSDGVFIYYDADQGRYIIQWQTGACVQYQGNWSPNAFEVILFDPQQHQTPTGDSQILFQYRTVNDVNHYFEGTIGATVGISSPDNLDGLTYQSWHINPDGAAPLQEGRAILWTTVAWTPQAVVTGRVVRWIDSTGVNGVLVRSGDSLNTLTDRQGNYSLIVPPDQPLSISASRELYGQVEDSIEAGVHSGDTVRVDFVLPHGWVTSDLDSVILSGGNDLPDYEAWGEMRFNNPGNRPAHALCSYFVSDSARWNPSLHLAFDPDTLALDSGTANQLVMITVTADTFGRFIGEIYVRSDTPAPELVLPMVIEIEEGVGDRPGAQPVKFDLAAYPNPFNGLTTISYSLPQTGLAKMVLLDLQGREVSRLLDQEMQPGRKQMSLNAERLPAGLYLLRLESKGKVLTRKLVLIP